MRIRFPLKVTLWGAVLCALSVKYMVPALAGDSAVITVDQGQYWTGEARADFYTQSQGARIMPLSWLKSLKLPDGKPFLADRLGRYGYLENPATSNSLPVGFSSAGPEGAEFAGMTCSACHTRQIEADGKAYRIDGGPAIVDAQRFFTDLDAAVALVLGSEASLQTFAASVLGTTTPQPDDVAALREMLKAWYQRYHTWTQGLPQPPWGVGRVDAVGMIFNRLTGLDIGPPPTHLIPNNIKIANAPVRYPFLWNSPTQDKTQWAGFADNGSDSLALARNLGQLYGVFGDFAPTKEWWHILGVNYLSNNSADFDGLQKLESLVKRIGPPKWPWPVDASLAEQGKAVYNRQAAEGGCSECHGIRPGQVQFPNNATWATPVQDVGTDSKQYDLLNWTASTGVLEGAQIPFIIPPLQPTDCAVKALAVSVLGSIIQKYVPLQMAEQELRAELLKSFKLPPSLQGLEGAFRTVQDFKSLGACQVSPAAKYEAKVMEGIWAAAPYLHNGSVPTLAELLKPPSERVSSFQVGPAYDKENVGLAKDQPRFGGYTLKTGCGDRNSGNSNCGHDYGTRLKPEEKKALLEYLKIL